jgi:hypothetical protein
MWPVIACSREIQASRACGRSGAFSRPSNVASQFRPCRLDELIWRVPGAVQTLRPRADLIAIDRLLVSHCAEMSVGLIALFVWCGVLRHGSMEWDHPTCPNVRAQS